MKKNLNIQLSYYLGILFFFSIIYLVRKHDVGNDSTISEWLINYSGGFTKRGLIGHVCIVIANFFNQNLRDVIVTLQILLVGSYFLLLLNFFKNILVNKIIILSIFTPIFILYPVAEIEVLARKELFIFCIFIVYLYLEKPLFRNIYKIVFLSIAILIWEPVIFYFTFFLAIDIIDNKIEKINKKFLINLLFYVPSLLVAFYIAFNPMTLEQHTTMASYLKSNFNENCYMSCALLSSKSSLYSQFEGNFGKYSFTIFFRYFLIILLGFGPLIILAKNSCMEHTKILYFKSFESLIFPIILILLPVILLFAMGYDWGRWVNISYVFSVIFYFYLYKKKIISINENFLKYRIFKLLDNKKLFVIIIVIFCFGWNPKTVMTGDIATNPGWKIPYNASKSIFGFKNFRILQDSILSKWHEKYIE